jgi:hypothetical protein
MERKELQYGLNMKDAVVESTYESKTGTVTFLATENLLHISFLNRRGALLLVFFRIAPDSSV